MTRAFLFALALAIPAAAAANNTGIFGKSGRDLIDVDGDGVPETPSTCTQCHVGNNGAAPSIAVTGFDGPFQAGGFADFTITVTSNDATGGITAAACPERCAGFNAAIDKGAGTFVIPSGSPVQANAGRDEVSHVAKSPFVGGAVSYHLALAGLVQGDHTLFIAGNDVDGQSFTGDRVATVALPFTVGAATTTPGSTPPPACGSAGAAPVGALALMLVAGRRRRRAARPSPPRARAAPPA